MKTLMNLLINTDPEVKAKLEHSLHVVGQVSVSGQWQEDGTPNDEDRLQALAGLESFVAEFKAQMEIKTKNKLS